jgi:hypothetical protein
MYMQYQLDSINEVRDNQDLLKGTELCKLLEIALVENKPEFVKTCNFKNFSVMILKKEHFLTYT